MAGRGPTRPRQDRQQHPLGPGPSRPPGPGRRARGATAGGAAAERANEALLAHLVALLGDAEQPPPDVVAAAKAAFPFQRRQAVGVRGSSPTAAS